MERIHTLIDKLIQQKNAQAPASHLLFTVQLLQQELSQLQSKNGSFSRNNVSVTLPVSLNFSEEALRIPFTEVAVEKQVFVLDVTEDILEEEINEPVASEPVVDKENEYLLRKPVILETAHEKPNPVLVEAKKENQPAFDFYNTAFESVDEAPTLTQYTQRKEVQHSISTVKESVNDKLKQDNTEVAHRLKETPIKDLRKAIGINDKFVFVKELFRGDDAMYERSIKTINGFHIFSEAEYWMTRELKTKVGWSDNNPIVQQFYNLVRRRFS